jgi:hypothetical protein
MFWPDMSSYSQYHTGGFYIEWYSCGISCYYLTGKTLDHYRAAASATVSGPYGGVYTRYVSIDPYYAVDVTDNMGGVHRGKISGTKRNDIKNYIAFELGIPVS